MYVYIGPGVSISRQSLTESTLFAVSSDCIRIIFTSHKEAQEMRSGDVCAHDLERIALMGEYMETSLKSSGEEPPGDSHRRTLLLSVLCGAVGGYFLLHPYVMIVYRYYETSSPQRSIAAGGVMMGTLSGVCHPDMLPMGIPFALLGGVAGAFFGLWLNGKNRKVEAEKKLALVEGVRQLMITLAHHLLNAAAGIGGLADLFILKEQDERKKRQLEIMKKEAVRIEAVVKSLQSLKTVTSERYIESSETLMIDIRKELQEKIEALNKEKIESPR